MAVTNNLTAVQWRSGDWLTGKRVRAYAAILLIIELAVFSFLVAGTHG